MFSSELCIYTSEEYFAQHTEAGNSGRFGEIKMLKERSLCKEWELILPAGFSELGVSRTQQDDEGNLYVSEHWYLGEVAEMASKAQSNRALQLTNLLR